MRDARPWLLSLVACVTLAGCEAQFDQTFVIDELSILAVQTEPAELVFNTDWLRQYASHELPPLPRIAVRVLAVNPEQRGGQAAIERYHWSIGDPPLEGVPTVVTEGPELVMEQGVVLPALEAVLDGEDLTPEGLADLLDQGPLMVPFVITVIAGEDSSTAVKLFTVRGTTEPEDEANQTPIAEGLSMDDRVWSEESLEVIGGVAFGPYTKDREQEVVFEIDPDDPSADDGDVETTMFVTGGTIGWSPESMRVWVQQTPGEDYEPEQVRVFLVLRDPQGAQSWVTIEQRLSP